MNSRNNTKLTRYAQELRKNMTKEEKHLWYDFLKQLPYTVNRQKVIGNYIVDFYIASVRIVIEIDGSQHYEDKNIKADIIRDEYLKKLGIIVLRYTNLDIKRKFNEVCEDILNHISTSSTASGPPSPKGKAIEGDANSSIFPRRDDIEEDSPTEDELEIIAKYEAGHSDYEIAALDKN